MRSPIGLVVCYFITDHWENARNFQNYLNTKTNVNKTWKCHSCITIDWLIYFYYYYYCCYSGAFVKQPFATKQNQTWALASRARSAAEVKRAEQRPLAAAPMHRCFPSVTLLRLHEDLSSYKVDRVLWAWPAMTTACALLSFGGHQLYVL